MIWKEKELRTAGDIMNALFACKTQDEALRFMNIYKAETPFAEENICFMIHYYDVEIHSDVLRWIGVDCVHS